MKKQPLFYILISAAFFGISPPFAKMLVADIPPVALAGLLYTGAFLGLSSYSLDRKSLSGKPDAEKASSQGNDIPWLTAAIVFGGIA